MMKFSRHTVSTDRQYSDSIVTDRQTDQLTINRGNKHIYAMVCPVEGDDKDARAKQAWEDGRQSMKSPAYVAECDEKAANTDKICINRKWSVSSISQRSFNDIYILLSTNCGQYLECYNLTPCSQAWRVTIDWRQHYIEVKADHEMPRSIFSVHINRLVTSPATAKSKSKFSRKKRTCEHFYPIQYFLLLFEQNKNELILKYCSNF